jgi:acetylornithine/N-succinyldiaminopimelate aminotransferase
VLVPNTDFVSAAFEQKLLTIAAGDNVVRLLPPLIVDDNEVAEAMNRLDAACATIERDMRSLAQRGAAE